VARANPEDDTTLRDRFLAANSSPRLTGLGPIPAASGRHDCRKAVVGSEPTRDRVVRPGNPEIQSMVKDRPKIQNVVNSRFKVA
jgi:hypothetical protein